MADRPVSAPRYRLLKDGEPMQPNDEGLQEDATTWLVVGDLWAGAKFAKRFYLPIRRPLTPTPHKEQTCQHPS